MADPNAFARWLAKELDATKQPIAERGNVLPLGIYEDGSAHLAWPGMISGVVDSANALSDWASNDRALVETVDPKTAFDAFNVAGAAGVGGLAAPRPRGAIAANGLRQEAPAAINALDMSLEARLARAKDMGFDTDTPLYRGLRRPYDEDEAAKMYYQMFTSDPAAASDYAMAGFGMGRPNVIDARARLGKNLEIDAGGVNFNQIQHRMIPDESVASRFGSYGTIDQVLHPARELGYDSVTVRNVIDNASDRPNTKPATVTAIFDPRNIRSVNAAFDPAKADSANLLAANPWTTAPISMAPNALSQFGYGYGERQDGTDKGPGYFGELQRPDGGVSTELSVGVEIDGQETEIPLLVPGLDDSEKQWLLSHEFKPSEVPQSIMEKAYDHALQRISSQRSPFYNQFDEPLRVPPNAFDDDTDPRRKLINALAKVY